MGNIYLLYGEEKYDLEQKLEKIKREFDNLEIGLNLFYITKDNADDLSSCIQGVTFFGSSKLIIIKYTNLKFNIDLLKDLDEDIKVVVIEDNVDKRTSEYKTLSKIAECIEYKYMDEKQVIGYIIKILEKYGKSISYDVAEYMQNICGNNKGNIVNELQKLVIYLDNENIVTKESIDKVCSKTLNAKIFDVLSKIVNKDKQNAILFLDELLKQKEPIVKIYVMLYKQIKQMYMIKYLKERKENDIIKILGIHPYTYKNLSKSCEKYTLDDLKQIIYKFDEYDKKTKIGEMDFEIGLKKIICDM